MERQILEGFRADVAELKELKQIAKRRSVISILEDQIIRIERQIEAFGPVKSKNSAATKAQTSIATPITTYSWNDEGGAIKIYITVTPPTEVAPENVNVIFKEDSLVLEVNGANNSGDRWFSVPKLFKKIDPKKSRFTVDRNHINITLKKLNDGPWEKLKSIQPLTKAAPPKDMAADPGASIMSLMKNMYEEGDADMKRTIAKAWVSFKVMTDMQQTESQEKTALGGMTNFS